MGYQEQSYGIRTDIVCALERPPVWAVFPELCCEHWFLSIMEKWSAALSTLALVVMAFVSKGLMGEFDGPLQWNWHQRGWPNFTYDQSALQDFEEQFLLSSGGGLSCKLRG